ncbi:iron-regulated transporter [Russula aff. rugulosa BPL654]|nr:iron-regulated transporter [Russula aff. rugulosa BPL654]
MSSNSTSPQQSDETRPLLAGPVASSRDQDQGNEVPTRLTNRIYVSHFLSTWNTRTFEFGAVLYLATIFPGTLLPMSVYALTRGLSAVLFAPAVGQYIDTSNRLQVVRLSIVLQRLAVAGSCVLFYVLAIRLKMPGGSKVGLLALLAIFACVEKLCAIMNLVSVERDWIVVVAQGNEKSLRTINAQMRRIDLMCKLIAPLFIALIDGFSTELAIIVNFAMNVASVVVEYFAIARVYYEVPALQQPKTEQREETNIVIPQHESRLAGLARKWQRVKTVASTSAKDFGLYFKHPAFLPSFAGALLYLTVLSFAGQMVTYLVSAGYSSMHIGIARGLSVAFEVLATWVAPWLMGKIGPIRSGLWLISWQMIFLGAGMAFFWTYAKDRPVVSASVLVAGTILSRLGLRGFDLSVQLIVQEEVEAVNRGAFSSVEAAWRNAFELCSYISTVIFSHPEQFRVRPKAARPSAAPVKIDDVESEGRWLAESR